MDLVDFYDERPEIFENYTQLILGLLEETQRDYNPEAYDLFLMMCEYNKVIMLDRAEKAQVREAYLKIVPLQFNGEKGRLRNDDQLNYLQVTILGEYGD